jgi:hypothetical protein
MQHDKTRLAIVGGASFGREAINQFGSVVGAASYPGLVFGFTDWTKHG